MITSVFYYSCLTSFFCFLTDFQKEEVLNSIGFFVLEEYCESDQKALLVDNEVESRRLLAMRSDDIIYGWRIRNKWFHTYETLCGII